MTTPWKPSYLATFEAVTECSPRTLPKTSAGVPSSGRQNGSPPAASISRSRSTLTPVSSGREARRPLKRLPSRVTRLVTRTIRCSVTASTKPKDLSIQARIASGGSRRPVVATTSKRRPAAARSSGSRASMRVGRSVILRSDVPLMTCARPGSPLAGKDFAPQRVAQPPEHPDQVSLVILREPPEQLCDRLPVLVVHRASGPLSLLGQLDDGSPAVRRVWLPPDQPLLLQSVHQRRDVAPRDAELLADAAHDLGPPAM